MPYSDVPSSIESKEVNIINSQVKSVIKTVFERCKKECNNNSLMVPLEEYIERVVYYTGFPKKYIYTLNDPDSSCSRKKIDDFGRYSVLKCLKELYTQPLSPTFRDLYECVKKLVPNLPDMADFQHELSLMGYGYKRTLNFDRILMEDPKKTFERYFYLSKIKKIRNDNTRKIYYIDERLIIKELDFKKPWIYDIDVSSLMFDKYVLFHMISRDGYENGLFCCQVTKEDFTKWVVDILLPIINPFSVIVMDQNPLHGQMERKSITKYHSKDEMLSWLMENNIPCNANMRKAELYDLIERHFKCEQQFDIDHILKAYGHEVLRLPLSFYDLSPTEMLWRYVISSGEIKEGNLITLVTLKNKLTMILNSIPLEKWQEFEKVIENKENDIYTVDEEIEKVLEKYKFDLSIDETCYSADCLLDNI